MLAPRHSTTQSETPLKSWRGSIQVHPAAQLFRLMSPDETKNLVEDIKKDGLINQIAVWQFQSADSNGLDHHAPYLLLEGRNAPDAGSGKQSGS